jgi:hypothetical protein
MKTVIIIATVLALSVPAVSGCGGVLGAITTILSIVTEGYVILDQVTEYVERFFDATPNDALEAKITREIARCRNALRTLEHLGRDGESLENEDIKAAMKEFGESWFALMDLVGPIGLHARGMPMRVGQPMVIEVNMPRAVRPTGLRSEDF